MKPIDRLALWLRQRAAEGLPMLNDREIARLLQVRSAKRIEHGIRRLIAFRMIRMHYRGAGPLIERRVEIATTGQLTGWSSPPPAPRKREPIPKAIVLVFERPTWAGLMRGRRFEDVKFRPKTAPKPAANIQNPGKTNADLRTRALGYADPRRASGRASPRFPGRAGGPGVQTSLVRPPLNSVAPELDLGPHPNYQA